MRGLLFIALWSSFSTAAHNNNDLKDDELPFKKKTTTTQAPAGVDEFRMEKRFGVGFSTGGGYSVLGLGIDFHVTPDFSLSAGIGTGLDYSTWNVEAKYYLSGRWVSPYFAAGLARWWTGGTSEKQIGPAVLRNKFLTADHDFSQGFSCFIFYPAIGVQFMHPAGFAVSVEGQYLFRLVNFANGTYAGASAYWYF